MEDLYNSMKQCFPYDQSMILHCIKVKNGIAMQKNKIMHQQMIQSKCKCNVVGEDRILHDI